MVRRVTGDVWGALRQHARDTKDELQKLKNTLPTHPVYDPDFPDDAVNTQIAFQGGKPFYFWDGVWYPFSGNADLPYAVVSYQDPTFTFSDGTVTTAPFDLQGNDNVSDDGLTVFATSDHGLFSFNDADHSIEIAEAGAYRIQCCANLGVSGTTDAGNPAKTATVEALHTGDAGAFTFTSMFGGQLNAVGIDGGSATAWKPTNDQFTVAPIPPKYILQVSNATGHAVTAFLVAMLIVRTGASIPGAFDTIVIP